MDKETKEFVEGAFEKWTGILVAELDRINKRFDRTDKKIDGVESRLDGMESRLSGVEMQLGEVGARLSHLEEETQETKSAVLSLEHNLQEKIEVQGDEIQQTRQRVERIETHFNLPHSLSV